MSLCNEFYILNEFNVITITLAQCDNNSIRKGNVIKTFSIKLHLIRCLEREKNIEMTLKIKFSFYFRIMRGIEMSKCV